VGAGICVGAKVCTSRDPPSRGGGGPAWDRLVAHIRLARDQLSRIPIATVSVPKIRGEVVETLVAAIEYRDVKRHP